MPAKVSTVPRKAPSQARAKATVDAILEATARVFMREGYDRASTNLIARAAGVSVGSLYQYFPGKEALAAALIDHHCRAMEAAMQVPDGALGWPLPELARFLIRGMLRAHQVHPKLHQVLMEQVPRVGRAQNVADFEQRVAVMVRGVLELRKRELRALDLELATFLIISSVEAVTHRAAIENPEYLSDPRLEDEVVELVVRYLGIKASKR